MTSREDFIQQQLCLVDGASAKKSASKYQKMANSPFVFFRGSAQLFYADLASGTLRCPSVFKNTPLTTVMGDCHTSNFGFFTEEGSHGDTVVFSPNDFDDACIGFAYWDLLRFLVSLRLAADHGKGVKSGKYVSEKDYSSKASIDSKQVDEAMHAFLDSYAEVLNQGLACKSENVGYLDLTFDDFETPSPLQKRYQKALSSALGGERFLEKSALAKAVNLTTFPLRFLDKPEKFTRDGINKEAVCKELAPYFFDHIIDVVKRVNSGTGSVNMDRLYLLVGPKEVEDASHVAACHVVEVKQQRQAAAIHYFPDLHHQNKLNPAHLTVKCQRRMLRKQDYCLDEAFFKGKHYLIRSRHHAKVGMDPEHITLGQVNAHHGGFAFYAAACGQSLARAHCRCDKSSSIFEQANADALRSSKDQLIEAANTYSQQVISDWTWFSSQV